LIDALETTVDRLDVSYLLARISDGLDRLVIGEAPAVDYLLLKCGRIAWQVTLGIVNPYTALSLIHGHARSALRLIDGLPA
jgi:hypothetical protein